jgi:hypothetical protein
MKRSRISQPLFKRAPSPIRPCATPFLQHTIEQSAWITRITSLGGEATAGRLGRDRVCALIAVQAETNLKSATFMPAKLPNSAAPAGVSKDTAGQAIPAKTCC